MVVVVVVVRWWCGGGGGGKVFIQSCFLVLWVVSEKNGCICMYIYMSVAKTLLVIHVVACLYVHFFSVRFLCWSVRYHS